MTVRALFIFRLSGSISRLHKKQNRRSSNWKNLRRVLLAQLGTVTVS
jgi:hypothetical protein